MGSQMIDRIINLLLLAAVAYIMSAGGASSPRGPNDPDYIVGEIAPSLSGVDYRDSDRTIVLYLRSTCRYCVESMPWFEKLSQQAQTTGARVVVISRQEQEVLERFVTDSDLSVFTTVSVGLDAWPKLTNTPGIVVVGRDGTVRGSWRGRLSDESQREIIRAVIETHP